MTKFLQYKDSTDWWEWPQDGHMTVYNMAVITTSMRTTLDLWRARQLKLKTGPTSAVR